MSLDVLDGVVAWVCCRSNEDNGIKDALVAKLRDLGAKPVSRLSKDVTHIVYKRKFKPTDEEKAQEDTELRQLYDRAFKVVPPPMIVTPLWVESSSQQRRRAMERHFIIAKPPENMLKHLSRTPPSLRKGTGTVSKTATSIKKPRRRQVLDAGLSPLSEHGSVQRVLKRPRTTYTAGQRTPGTTAISTAAGSGDAFLAATANRTPLSEHNVLLNQTALPQVASSKHNNKNYEGDENVDANLLPLPHVQSASKQLTAQAERDASTEIGPHANSPVVPHTTGRLLRKRSSMKLKPLAATAAGSVVDAVTTALGMFGADRNFNGRSLRLGLLGSKRKTQRGDPVVSAAVDGQQIALVQSNQLLGVAEAAVPGCATLVDASLSSLVQTSRLQQSAGAGNVQQFSILQQQQVPPQELTGAGSPEDSSVSTVPATPCERLPQDSHHQPPSAQPPPSSPPTITAAQPAAQNPSTKLKPPSPKPNPTDHSDMPVPMDQSDNPLTSDDEDIDVDALASSPAPSIRKSKSAADSPMDIGIPPKCPSPATAFNSSPPPAATTSPMAIVHSPMDKGRTSPGRVRQLWNIPPAMEAKRASCDSPAWKLKAEAAMAEAALAFETASPARPATSPTHSKHLEGASPARPSTSPMHNKQLQGPSPSKQVSSPQQHKPAASKSPKSKLTRSLSAASMDEDPVMADNAVTPNLHDTHGSDDLDMMLGGVPNIVAKTMSPAGKLASPKSLGSKSRSRSTRSKKTPGTAPQADKADKQVASNQPSTSACKSSASKPATHTRSTRSAAKAAAAAAAAASATATTATTSAATTVAAPAAPDPAATIPAAATTAAAAAAGIIEAKQPVKTRQTGTRAASTRQAVAMAALSRPKSTATTGDTAAALGRRSISVPPARAAWVASAVAEPGPSAQTARVLCSTISVPMSKFASDLAFSTRKNTRKLLTADSAAAAATAGGVNRLATSADGLLQVSAVEAVQNRPSRGKQQVSIADKHTAASRARFEKQPNAVVEQQAAPASKPVIVAAPSIAAGRPKSKYLAFTSLSGEVQQLVKVAVRRLPGLRMCIEGNEDGRITHLVVGAERRTLKVLLAIANGAYLLSPAWITDSLDAQEWLPEDQYRAETRFTTVADRVREQMVTGRLIKPLDGHMVFIHVPTHGHGHTGERAELPSQRRHTLQRLVQALGGKVAPARACTLCIACEDVKRPKGMPEDVKMIRDEWLFLVAENYQQVGMAEHMIVEEEQLCI